MFDSCPPILSRIARFVCCAGITSFLVSYSGTAWCWETAHGKPDNTGFEDVVTAPATIPKVVGNLGTFARGAGPVVAPDGTVYIGSQEGKLMSFKPDGTPGWSRDVGRDQSIVASPAIGSDGTIYVVGIKSYTDHRVDPPVKRVDAALHRFNSGGAYLGWTPFPEHNGGGGTTASPNLWRFNGIELVLVPAPYRREVGGGIDIRLIAFSQSGAVVADQRATSIVPEITGGANLPGWSVPICLLPPFGMVLCYLQSNGGFDPPTSSPSPPPLPGVGLYTNPLGGTPWILLSDHYKDFVGFTLSGSTFYEVFRVHDNNRFMRSAPTIVADKHSIIGTEDIKRDNDGGQSGAGRGGAVFSGPNSMSVNPITGLWKVYATPTTLPDGRTILIQGEGDLAVVKGNQVLGRFPLPGQSIASAAASRTHVFVSTESAFQTFDAASMNEVARIDWAGGGMSPPVIGPQGHVYVIASNSLFAFPPPVAGPVGNWDATGNKGPVLGSGIFQDSGHNPPPPKPQSQTYQPPLTTSGNRLLACLELDGDDCGKGDHGTIAQAFCAKQGYSQASEINVDSKKVKAETLNGEYCSKKKCKVFDKIVCNM